MGLQRYWRHTWQCKCEGCTVPWSRTGALDVSSVLGRNAFADVEAQPRSFQVHCRGVVHLAKWDEEALFTGTHHVEGTNEGFVAP